MMNTETKPIFYDPKRRRMPFAMAVALLFSVAGALFCVSLAVAPLLPAVHLPHPRFIDNLELANPALTRREIVERRVALRRDKAQLAILNERRRTKDERRRTGAEIRPPNAAAERHSGSQDL